MDEMDGYYHWNKISFCPKYIQWTRLSDKSEMIYSKKSYRKPVDEIKLLAHIKGQYWQIIEEQHRKEKTKIWVSPKWWAIREGEEQQCLHKEFMKLEPGKIKFYDSRKYK